MAAAALVVVGMSLAGCAKMTNGIIGLQRLDGHLFAYVEMCPDREIDRLEMFEREGVFRDEWEFAAPVDAGTLDLGVYADTVSLLDTGNQFYIGGSSSVPFDGDIANGPDFTSGDLAELSDGEILAHDASGDWSLQHWNPDTFSAMVAVYCAPYGS
jgi:hypothetical protein